MFLPDGEAMDLVKDASFAYDQIADGTTEAVIDGVSTSPFDELRIENFVAPQNGYILVYLSNEGSLTDVYFDDMEITVDEHPVIQKDDYYPFGLQHAGGYQRMTAKENRFKYNGKELIDDLDLNWYAYGARNYDATIGRFFNVDRFSEKYYDFTPYQYGANNPIKFIDINGDSLWIQVDKNNKALYENGKVYNKDGTTYAGKGTKTDKNGDIKLTGFLKSAVSNLNQISSGKQGNKMVDEIQSSSDNVTIVNGAAGSNNSYDTKTNEINFDLSSQNGGLNTQGSTLRPTFIGLAHELAHSLDDIRGTVSGKKVGGTIQAEIFASHKENQFRAENGLPLRAQYNSSTPIIDSFGNSIYYNSSYYNDLKVKGQPVRSLVPAYTAPQINIRKR